MPVSCAICDTNPGAIKVESPYCDTYYIAVPYTRIKFPACNRAFALALTALLSACATAPDTATPDSSKTRTTPQTFPAYLSSTPPANSAQHQDAKLNVQFDWWKLLQSPQLSSLIEQSFLAHPTVDDAQNVLLKARQSDIVRSGYFHSAIMVSDAANGRSKLILQQERATPASEELSGEAYYGFHSQQLTVAYQPEALHISQISLPKSEAEVKQLQLEATYRTLASNLIACTLQEASLRTQMATARKIAAIEQSLLAISRKRLKTGAVTQEYVNAMQASAERSEQVLLTIKKQFDQTRELLRILLGIPQNAQLPDGFELSALHPSQELPLEVSAVLIEQRPDVRAAQLEMLPASTQYQNTLNIALKNTESSLSAIYSDALALKAATISEQEHRAALEAARQSYAANTADYQEVLAAEQNLQLATLRLTQARAQHLGNAVTLYHALGGAWWNDTVSLEIASDLHQKAPLPTTSAPHSSPAQTPASLPTAPAGRENGA